MSNKQEDLALVKKWVSDLFGVTEWKPGSDYYLQCSVILHDPNKEALQILYASLELFSIKCIIENYRIEFHEHAHPGDLEITLGGTRVAHVWFDFFKE